MKSNLFIPRVIKVGFQKRSDTYTKMLAYVIYYDEQGKLRKETSWENWRDEKIPDVEYDNEPTQGFVLNKKAGGYQYHYDMRQTYVRVFDPRGFEIEITIPNLLYILENTNSIKGKGLEGEFVYSWDGKDIVLMPVDSPDYKALMEFRNKKYDSEAIKAKDLKIGAVYLNKDNEEVVYLGKFPKYGFGYKFNNKYFKTYHAMNNYAEKQGLHIVDYRNCNWRDRTVTRECNYETIDDMNHGNHYWFEKVDKNNFGYKDYKIIKSLPKGYLIEVISEEPIADYSERYEKLQHDCSFSPIDSDADDYEHYADAIEFEDCCISWYRKSWYTYIDGKRIKCCLIKSHPNDVCELYNVKISNGDSLDQEMTIEEIFNKYQPQYLVQYLKNGKEYKRYK